MFSGDVQWPMPGVRQTEHLTTVSTGRIVDMPDIWFEHIFGRWTGALHASLLVAPLWRSLHCGQNQNGFPFRSG
jgi:hypothetical protein